MAKKRTGAPWMPAGEYGRSLLGLTVNLLVRDVERSAGFYRAVFEAEVRYADVDFAAMRMTLTPGPSPENGRGESVEVDFMLHADHAYESHPWQERLVGGEARGLGAEIRLFGVDPDAVEGRARGAGAPVMREAHDRGHGWREVWMEDPGGYVWAVGRPIGRPAGIE